MTLQLRRHFGPLPPSLRGGGLTIGSFDGLHRGHQTLIRHLIATARPAWLVTFEPLPREFFLGDLAPPRLTRRRERLALLNTLGLDGVLLLPFNRALADLAATDFVARLVDWAAPTHIAIGDDFRFGQGGQGDAALLTTLGSHHGFRVLRQDTQQDDHQRISSTRVRVALQSGDFAQAARLLGRDYALLGRVHHGDALGRQLGFPTANLPLNGPPPPLRGVYAVRVDSNDAPLHDQPAVANLGTRPTVNGQQLRLEVHLLDWQGDLYGRHLTVRFCHALRPEQRFSSLDDLRQQLRRDVAQARALFAHEVTP